MKRTTSLIAATALAAAAIPAATTSAVAAPGTTSLAAVLTSDGNHFDRDAGDFDILTEAALAVLKAKPDSAVSALTDGRTRLTVLAPTDRAFRLLAKDLTGKRIASEKKVFRALVAAAGVDTIEAVLLYHVVPGATLGSGKVLKSNNARLATAAGRTVTVKVSKGRKPQVKLVDRDRDARDARVILKAVDINKGNKQIAHGVDRVLRPIDL